jgi:OFA family oxalate/formate antiporter-like MFS transporter
VTTTTATDATRGRWLVAGSAVLFQLALDAVYAWSVFSKALQKPGSDFHLTRPEPAPSPATAG